MSLIFLSSRMLPVLACTVMTGLLTAADPNLTANADSGSTGMNLLELLERGGWFLLPIVLVSFVGVALGLERLGALRRQRVLPASFVAGVEQACRQDDASQWQAVLGQEQHALARILRAGLERRAAGTEVVERAMSDAGGAEVARLRRHLRLIYGLASVAPMLGLLGTVWGMITAFKTTTEQGLGAEVLAGGIYEALITTFAGLCVAIPILMLYYYLQGRIEALVSDINDQCQQVLRSWFAQDLAVAAPAAEQAA